MDTELLAPPASETKTKDPMAEASAREAFPSTGAVPSRGGEPRESTKVTSDLNDKPKVKSAIDKVGAAKNPDPEPEIAADGNQQADAAPKKKVSPEENLRILGKAKEEWDKARPEFEKTKAELTALRQEHEKLKSLGLNEKEREEFTRYRDMNAVEAVRQSEEFQQKVKAPIQKSIGKIKSASKNANLSEEAHSRMLMACDIDDEWQRNKAIHAAIATADLDSDDVRSLSDIVIAQAKELNENLYPREDEMLARAEEIELSARERDRNQFKEMQGKQKAEFDASHKEVFSILAGDKLKQLVEDPTLAIEGVGMSEAMKNAAPANNIRDRAFEVHAAAALPFVVEDRNRWRAKFAELERANRLRDGAAPSRNDGERKTAVPGQQQTISAEEAFGRRR